MAFDGSWDLLQFIKDFELISILILGAGLYFLHHSLQNLRAERNRQHDAHVTKEEKNWERVWQKFGEFDTRLTKLEKEFIRLETRYFVEHKEGDNRREPWRPPTTP